MTSQIPERRRGRRVVALGETRGRVRATVKTRVIDLGVTGAKIEHSNMLQPGCTCVLELPESLGTLALAARVVRTVEIGTAEKDAVPPTLRYESGLVFTDLSPEQHLVLESVLERLLPPRVMRDSGLAG